MRTEPILTQIETSGLHFREKGAAEALAQVSQDFKVSPACFVVMTGEKASAPARAAGGYRQKLTISFSVVIVLDARKDDESEAYREGVKSALAGFKHPDSSTGALCDYIGWRLVPYPGKLIYEIQFSTTDNLRKTS